jgi:molybdopterin converting factor small subunit
MAKIIIPTPLRKFTSNEGTIQITGDTIGEAILDLTNKFPDLKNNILDDEGNLRNFVRIYLGDDDIKTLDDTHTSVEENSVISIIPAIAGGSK